MLTWKLWRGLKRPPPKNPLFQRVMSSPPQEMPWYLGCAIVLVAPFLLLPAFVFMSAVYGLRWTIMIAGMIARERESGMFELIALSPNGLFGSSRAIMSACLHRNESLAQMQSFGAWIMRFAMGLVLMLTIASLTTPIVLNDADPLLGQIITPLYIISLAIAVYVDHIHSILVAELVGMLVPIYTTRRVDASLGALVLYLLIQVGTYALTLLIGFAILPFVLELLPFAPQLRAIILPFGRLAIFYSIREIIIRYLWRRLLYETNAAPSEMDFMTA